MATRDTKEKILDAAERLFADQGFDSTSLRTITSEAEANLAAVNYHFGSKDALIEAVFARRLLPLNRERVALLDRLEHSDDAAEPTIEQIVEAFVGPALRMSRVPGGAMFMRLFGQALSERDDRIRRIFTGQFRAVVGRFVKALGLRLPDLQPEDVFWRMMFMVGSMGHTMALSDKLPDISGGLCDASDIEATIQRLVPFIAAGMRASAPVFDRAGGSS